MSGKGSGLKDVKDLLMRTAMAYGSWVSHLFALVAMLSSSKASMESARACSTTSSITAGVTKGRENAWSAAT